MNDRARPAIDSHPAGKTPVTELAYTNYTNVDAGFVRPYERGDRLVRGHVGTIEVESGDGVTAIAERLFARHNRDDRPDRQLCPSMSVGDVIVIGEIAVSVAGVGFQQVDVDANDLIVDRSGRQVIDEPRPVGSTVRTIVAGWSTPQPTVARLGITVEGFGR
jgi:hypothetical protein